VRSFFTPLALALDALFAPKGAAEDFGGPGSALSQADYDTFEILAGLSCRSRRTASGAPPLR
jgi:hypothetical protein